MSEIVKVCLIKPDGKKVCGIVNTGEANAMLFSVDFCKGEIDKAIDNLVNKMQPESNTLSPIGYGLIIIDFPNKTIYNMQEYDSLCIMPLFYANAPLKRDIESLIENNLIDVYDRRKKERYSLQDFFDTTQYRKIINMISGENKLYKGIASKYKSLEDFILAFTPKIIDFDIISYKNDMLDLVNMLIDKEMVLNEKEIEEWLIFAEKEEKDTGDLKILLRSGALYKKLTENVVDEEKRKIRNKI